MNLSSLSYLLPKLVFATLAQRTAKAWGQLTSRILRSRQLQEPHSHHWGPGAAWRDMICMLEVPAGLWYALFLCFLLLHQ